MARNFRGLAAGKDFMKKFSQFDDRKATPIAGKECGLRCE